MKRNRGLIALIALATLAVSGCDGRVRESHITQSQVTESGKVYEAVLGWFESGNHPRYIGRNAQSPTSPMKWGKLNALTVLNNQIAIYSTYAFPDDRKTHNASDFGSYNVHIIEQEEEDLIFEQRCKKGWKLFYKKFPDAKSLIKLSKVGFRPNNNKAIVYFVFFRGCLDGGGAFILLEKKEGRWSVVKTIGLWIS